MPGNALDIIKEFDKKATYSRGAINMVSMRLKGAG